MYDVLKIMMPMFHRLQSLSSLTISHNFFPSLPGSQQAPKRPLWSWPFAHSLPVSWGLQPSQQRNRARNCCILAAVFTWNIQVRRLQRKWLEDALEAQSSLFIHDQHFSNCFLMICSTTRMMSEYGFSFHVNLSLRGKAERQWQEYSLELKGRMQIVYQQMYKSVGLRPRVTIFFWKDWGEGVKMSCKRDCYDVCDADTAEACRSKVSRKGDWSSFYAHRTKVYSGSRFSICSSLDFKMMFFPLNPLTVCWMSRFGHFMNFHRFWWTFTTTFPRHLSRGFVPRCVLSLRRTLTISLLLLWVPCQPENQAGQSQHCESPGTSSIPAATEPLQMYQSNEIMFWSPVWTCLDWPITMFLPWFLVGHRAILQGPPLLEAAMYLCCGPRSEQGLWRRCFWSGWSWPSHMARSSETLETWVEVEVSI